MKALLIKAQEYCEDKGHRLTAPRIKVLEILGRSEKPVGAYDVLRAMPKGTQPPTVYRALEFWEGEGFIHRIASLNAYAVCNTNDHDCHHKAQFLICDKCQTIAEIHTCHLPASFEKQARATGFTPRDWSLEIHGLCGQCR